MSADAGFLAAIRADPNDNAIRLIDADYLADSGDPLREARADWIGAVSRRQASRRCSTPRC